MSTKQTTTTALASLHELPIFLRRVITTFVPFPEAAQLTLTNKWSHQHFMEQTFYKALCFWDMQTFTELKMKSPYKLRPNIPYQDWRRKFYGIMSGYRVARLKKKIEHDLYVQRQQRSGPVSRAKGKKKTLLEKYRNGSFTVGFEYGMTEYHPRIYGYIRRRVF